MRDVTLDISLIGLVVGDIIKLQLVDSMGNAYLRGGYSIDESITLSTATFTKNLLENESLEDLTHYKITLVSGVYYNFILPENTSNKAHDLYALLKFGCVDSVMNAGKLDKNFLKKLDVYFSGRDAHFNVRQQDVVTLYEYYADNIINTTSTIDIIRVMDEYLSTIQKGTIL